ncbi:reverse transcriptase, partial [Lasius niger]
MVELAGRETTTNEIDSLCDELAEELTKGDKPSHNEVSRSSKSHKTQKNRRNKARPPNRVEKRRFAFAKCQELMNNCPKKLSDAVAANDLSILQMRLQPETAKTRELYIGLWGTPGPQQEPVCHATTEIPAGKVLLPITLREVEDKTGRIAISSAAGIDGIVTSGVTILSFTIP